VTIVQLVRTSDRTRPAALLALCTGGWEFCDINPKTYRLLEGQQPPALAAGVILRRRQVGFKGSRV
jgi:hypothetical protein